MDAVAHVDVTTIPISALTSVIDALSYILSSLLLGTSTFAIYNTIALLLYTHRQVREKDQRDIYVVRIMAASWLGTSVSLSAMSLSTAGNRIHIFIVRFISYTVQIQVVKVPSPRIDG